MALCVWPFIHPFNFRFVPIQHRLLVLNICSLGVFSYATFVSEKKTDVAVAAALFDAGEGHASGRPFIHAQGSVAAVNLPSSVAEFGGDLAMSNIDLKDVTADIVRLDARLEAVEDMLGCHANGVGVSKRSYTDQ